MHPMTFSAGVFCAALALLAASEASAATNARPPALKPPFIPTSLYRTKRIQGWTVRVDPALLAERRDIGKPALELLSAKLLDIVRAVPPKALAELRKTPIWISVSDGHAPCAEYHPNRQWLVDNGYNPDKAKCVEIGNAANFLNWSKDQPAMVLHELAHAYHDRVLGFENPEVQAAYDAALKSGKYQSVLQIRGKMERAYALTDAKEFFAECSEAFFGTNDFYPFVRAELQQYDPATYDLLARMWGVR
jgi:hypothetical protein